MIKISKREALVPRVLRNKEICEACKLHFNGETLTDIAILLRGRHSHAITLAKDETLRRNSSTNGINRQKRKIANESRQIAFRVIHFKCACGTQKFRDTAIETLEFSYVTDRTQKSSRFRADKLAVQRILTMGFIHYNPVQRKLR